MTLCNKAHILHYLLPAKRDTEVVSHLRSTKIFPNVRARTSRLKIHLFYMHRTIFDATCSFNFECMPRMLFVLIQPRGCHIPIKGCCTHPEISSAPKWNRTSVEVRPRITPSMSSVQGSETKWTYVDKVPLPVYSTHKGKQQTMKLPTTSTCCRY